MQEIHIYHSVWPAHQMVGMCHVDFPLPVATPALAPAATLGSDRTNTLKKAPQCHIHIRMDTCVFLSNSYRRNVKVLTHT